MLKETIVTSSLYFRIQMVKRKISEPYHEEKQEPHRNV
jgi:hypothetical protein